MAENEKVKSCLRSCCRRWDQLGLPNHWVPRQKLQISHDMSWHRLLQKTSTPPISPQFSPCFSRILHLRGSCRHFSSRSLWCQGRLRSDGRQHHRRRRRRRLRHGLDGLDGRWWGSDVHDFKDLICLPSVSDVWRHWHTWHTSSTDFNISGQKHHETSILLLFYSGFVNRISRYTYPSFPFMSIHFYLKESVKDTPCLLDTLQQVVDLATQTLHVFHLCGSCVCVCGWCENSHETGINWG